MDRLIYTAMSGANAAASRQAVLSNNLANASTNGFRAELSTYRAVPLQGEGATTRVFAVEATAGHLDRPGPAMRTDRSMDVMANGNSWFAVQALDGTEAYTRNGSLAVSANGVLEGSNVNPIETMVGMIQTARQFETQMRLLQTAESNDRSAGQLLGLQG